MNCNAPFASTSATLASRPSAASDKASNIASREIGDPDFSMAMTIFPMVPCAMPSAAASASNSSREANFGDFAIPSLHPVVCTSDGRGHPAQAKGESAGRGGKFARAVFRAARDLDDHWIGDLIGAVCLFALGWMGLAIGWVLQ